MAGVRHTLRASTLAETLVMMLVAGIVFLVATEALTLFSRLIARRTTALVENGRQSDGIFRIGQLLIAADSIKEEFGGGESLRLYRAGHETRLSSVDSTVLYAAGAFRDTLLRRVGRIRLIPYDTAADTVEIEAESRLLKFPVRHPAWERYETTITRIENGYGSDDEP